MRYCLTLSEREKLCQRYAWAIPDPSALRFVAKWLGSRAVEMGAGTGYWAWQLQQMGVQMDAYDVQPREQAFYPVWTGRPEDLWYFNCPLLLCWPPYNTPMASECLQHYAGERIVYVGEPEGGYCADEAFWQRIQADWRMVACHPILRWVGINDGIMVFERKA